MGAGKAAPLVGAPMDGAGKRGVMAATEVTAETVNGFLEAYGAGALERKQLS